MCPRAYQVGCSVKELRWNSREPLVLTQELPQGALYVHSPTQPPPPPSNIHTQVAHLLIHHAPHARSHVQDVHTRTSRRHTHTHTNVHTNKVYTHTHTSTPPPTHTQSCTPRTHARVHIHTGRTDARTQASGGSCEPHAHAHQPADPTLARTRASLLIERTPPAHRTRTPAR